MASTDKVSYGLVIDTSFNVGEEAFYKSGSTHASR